MGMRGAAHVLFHGSYERLARRQRLRREDPRGRQARADLPIEQAGKFTCVINLRPPRRLASLCPPAVLGKTRRTER